MARATLEERIANQEKKVLEEQQKVAIQKERLRRLQNALKEKERKARTRRLIENGAILEKISGREVDTPEMREFILHWFFSEKKKRDGGTFTFAQLFQNALSSAMAKKKETNPNQDTNDGT